jgi:hypothetical protein
MFQVDYISIYFAIKTFMQISVSTKQYVVIVFLDHYAMIVYQSRTDCLVLVTTPGFDGGGCFEAVLGPLAGILSFGPTGALPPAGGPT